MNSLPILTDLRLAEQTVLRHVFFLLYATSLSWVPADIIIYYVPAEIPEPFSSKEGYSAATAGNLFRIYGGICSGKNIARKRMGIILHYRIVTISLTPAPAHNHHILRAAQSEAKLLSIQTLRVGIPKATALLFLRHKPSCGQLRIVPPCPITETTPFEKC